MSKEANSSGQAARGAVSILFSFVLSLVLLAATVLLIVWGGLFYEKNFVSVLDPAYYDGCLETIEKQARYYTLPTGIDPTAPEGVFREDELQYHVTQYISAAYKGETYEPDLSEPRERLIGRTKELFQGEGLPEDQNTDEIIEAYADDILEIYTEYAKMPGLSLITNLRGRFAKLFVPVLAVLAVAAVLFSLLIRKLHHFPHRAYRYLAYACGGTAVMCFALPGWMLLTGKYKGLNLQPAYFYHFGVSLIEHLLRLCLIGGAVWLAVMLLCILISGLKRRSLIRKAQME